MESTCAVLRKTVRFRPRLVVASPRVANLDVMTSLQRIVLPASFVLKPATLWRSTAIVLALTAWLVARSCGYEVAPAVHYFGYIALYVVLPGTVVLYGVKRRPVSLAEIFALSIPTGFALEIFS